MSYPSIILPLGLNFEYKKTPKFNNIKQTPQSGRHPAVATLQSGTLFEFEVNFNYLKQNGVTTANDLQYVQEFYEAMGGGFQLFEFDPMTYNLEDTTVTHDYTQLKSGFFGLADGVNTVYPLWRSTNVFGGGIATLVERIQIVTAVTGVYVNNVPVSGYTITDTAPATITFSSPPTAGATMAWEGRYAYLCQFAEDTQDFEEFSFQLWQLKSLRLESVNL